MKLVAREPESRALRAYLRRERERLSCSFARTEILRAVRPFGPAAIDRRMADAAASLGFRVAAPA